MAILDRARRLFRGSAPDDTTDQSFLRAAADMGDHRLANYNLYAAYYDGEKALPLLDRAKEFLEEAGVPFTENFSETVVDSFARRLEVESFEAADHEDVSEWINQTMWPASEFDQLQAIVHVETPKLGDGFLIASVDHQSRLPRFNWNRPHSGKPVYSDGDNGDEMVYFVKRWNSNRRSLSNPAGADVIRMNIFYPDRIEKWFAADKDGELWDRWLEEGDLDDDGAPQWPTPWVDNDDVPLGIPVFHFRNKPQGRRLGRSEIRGTIPFQRQLDKQVIDLFYVMDLQGWPQRWGTGLSGDEKVKVAIGEILKATDDKARFGQFDPADPDAAVKVIEATLRRMSAKTATPLHELISGTPPSGESQKTAEHGLVEKAEDFHTFNGGTWAKASAYGWRLASVFADDVPEYDPAVRVQTNWEDAATRNEEAEASVYESHQRLGVSKATIIRKLGYDPDEEAAKRAEEADAAAEAAMKAFDRGNTPPFGGGGGGE